MFIKPSIVQCGIRAANGEPGAALLDRYRVYGSLTISRSRGSINNTENKQARVVCKLIGTELNRTGRAPRTGILAVGPPLVTHGPRNHSRGVGDSSENRNGPSLDNSIIGEEFSVPPEQKPMCNLNLGNLVDAQERHITNVNVEILGFMSDSIVGGVCSPTSEVLASLNKGVPPPAYFDWRGWFRAGLPFFRRDMTLRCSALILPHGSR
ncbi:hypothetical protein J6590_053023 [Homalodisca vitripennis]|nr:hypothetical protein J6590_053023 [Homalodisca vitripennis]